MMLSIRTRLTLLLVIFVSLVAVSVGATFWGLEKQADNALVINLAGRQRMLVQQMTRLSMEVSEGEQKHAEIESAAGMFERTLLALQYGGETVNLPDEFVVIPGTIEKDIQEQLGRVEQVWENYQTNLDQILSSSPGSQSFQVALESLEALSPVLVAEADAAVHLFQTHARQEVNQLRWVQVSFFAGALLLLGVGSYFMHASILRPLRQLGQSAGRIGKGDLNTQVNVAGPSEVSLLADTMETMRADLQISLQKLVESAETLDERVRHRTRELNALYEVSREISSRLELNHVLHSVTDKARQLLGSQVALLCLLDSSQPVLSLQSASGAEDAVKRTSTEVDNPYVQEVVSQTCPASQDSRYCRGNCGILNQAYRASHLAAPLKVENRIIGALCVGSNVPGCFQEEAPALLSRLANAAAVAIENAQLYAQAERAATLEERQRLAAEMHDGVAQMISYLGIMVDQTEEMIESGQLQQAEETLQRMRQGIDRASVEVRRSISNLRDEVPALPGLQGQLAELVEELSQAGHAPVDWVCRQAKPLRLPSEDAKLVVGIAREALVNAQRHARASHIALRLEVENDQAELEISDNGIGYDPEEPPADGRKHFGLDILRARASGLGGELQIQSTLGVGTCVQLRWPVRKTYERTMQQMKQR